MPLSPSKPTIAGKNSRVDICKKVQVKSCLIIKTNVNYDREMYQAMAGKQGHRVCQLTKDTAQVMYNTCYGLAELAKHQIEEKGFKYVCLGEFSTYHLEKAFSKFRQGSGGTYFINAQQVSEKLRINKAKLHLQLNHDQVLPGGEGHHECND